MTEATLSFQHSVGGHLASARSKAVDTPVTGAMVSLQGLTKSYPGQNLPSVTDVNLDIHEGEIFGLLGPSGCGKTTTLRMVAGLEDPSGGSIHFKDKPIVIASKRYFLPPEKRSVGMVFQSYAIWPHMTVAENIAYPLKVRRVPAREIKERVHRTLELVGLAHLADRSAMQLSGGQQQRVALARAVVYEPSLLLLDEPFSNLDTKLRDQMRYEVKALQQKLKITVLFVTHDQVEALSLSTRLAVLDQGKVQQVGTPRELYEHPSNEFVRDFLGRATEFRGVVTQRSGNSLKVQLAGGLADLTLDAREIPFEAAQGDTIRLSVRPEDLQVGNDIRDAIPMFNGHVTTALFTGERVEYRVQLDQQEPIGVFGSRHAKVCDGDRITISVPDGASGLWLARPA